jgi:hypothetical protein
LVKDGGISGLAISDFRLKCPDWSGTLKKGRMQRRQGAKNTKDILSMKTTQDLPPLPSLRLGVFA